MMRVLRHPDRSLIGLFLLVAVLLVVACDSPDSSDDTRSGSSELSEVPAVVEGSPSYLFVLDAASGTSDGSTLVLSSVNGRVSRFTDRPFRKVDHLPVEEFVGEWDALFSDSPPNVAVTWDVDGEPVSTAVEFTDVVFEDGTLTITFNQLEESDILGESENVEIPERLSEVSLVIDSASGFVVRGFEICLIAENPIRSSCATPTDSVLNALNVSGPFPEEEISGVWQNTTFASGGVVVHDDATWAKANLVFRCAGTGDPSDVYQTVLDWIGDTFDMDVYGPIPAGEPDCGSDVSQAWCSGGEYGNVAGNKLQCNWTWNNPPSLASVDLFSSAEILNLVPEPWPKCYLKFSVDTVNLDYWPDDNDWDAPELPPTVCQRMQGVVDQIHHILVSDGSKEISQTYVLMPPGMDEQWSCDTTWSYFYTGSGDQASTTTYISIDIHCTIPGTTQQAWLVTEGSGFQGDLPYP